MSTSANRDRRPLAVGVRITTDSLCVDLSDGRSLSVPTSWYPRLAQASEAERTNWTLIASGEGIHWPEIDEDISVEALLAGQSSNESAASLHRWQESRRD